MNKIKIDETKKEKTNINHFDAKIIFFFQTLMRNLIINSYFTMFTLRANFAQLILPY